MNLWILELVSDKLNLKKTLYLELAPPEKLTDPSDQLVRRLVWKLEEAVGRTGKETF